MKPKLYVYLNTTYSTIQYNTYNALFCVCFCFCFCFVLFTLFCFFLFLLFCYFVICFNFCFLQFVSRMYSASHAQKMCKKSSHTILILLFLCMLKKKEKKKDSTFCFFVCFVQSQTLLMSHCL